MFTHILVPLDGSKLAEEALSVAARIARASSARIVLVRAIVAPVTYGFMYEGDALRWKLMQDETEAATSYLDEIARSPLLARLAVDKVVKVGAAADVILDVAAERGVDLVTLTSHGRTGIGRWVLGSVADHVAHHSIAPVLILHGPHGGDSAAGASISPEELTRIVVPLDGSSLAEAALEPARSLALALGEPGQASLHLVLVVAPFEAEPQNMPEAFVMDGAKAYLERTAQHLREESPGTSLTVTWSIMVNLDIAQGILATAQGEEGEQGAQGAQGAQSASRGKLIAMATHGQGGLARWALGSVADRVLHTAKLSLLMVRPPMK